MKLHRRMTLIELIFSVSLLGGVIMTLGSMTRISLRWNAAVGKVVNRSSVVTLLRTQLARAARSAQPIQSLSIDLQGRLIEGETSEESLVTWGDGQALVFRNESGYMIFNVEGTDLVARRISTRGRTSTLVVARTLKSASFTLLRDGEGAASGIEFRVAFERGPDANGFVALRTTPVEHAPPSSPSPAPRFSRKGN